MSELLKGVLTVIVSTLLISAMFILLNLISGRNIPFGWAAFIGALFGVGYGLEAGIVGIYPLSTFRGWVENCLTTQPGVYRIPCLVLFLEIVFTHFLAALLRVKVKIRVGLFICLHRRVQDSGHRCCRH